MRILREGEKGRGGKKKWIHWGNHSRESYAHAILLKCVCYFQEKKTPPFFLGGRGERREREERYTIFLQIPYCMLYVRGVFFSSMRECSVKRECTHTHTYIIG